MSVVSESFSPQTGALLWQQADSAFLRDAARIAFAAPSNSESGHLASLPPAKRATLNLLQRKRSGYAGMLAEKQHFYKDSYDRMLGAFKAEEKKLLEKLTDVVLEKKRQGVPLREQVRL